MQRALGALLGEQRLGDAARPVVVGELGQVGRLHRVAPLARQVLERDAERPLEAALDAARHRRLEDLPDCLVAPLLPRSEEHTSELQSLAYLVCRLLLE